MENEKKKELRRLAEQKELKRLEKEEAKSGGKYYLLLLMVVLTIIYVVDELASNMNGTMQTYVILDLFNIPDVNDKRYASTLASLTAFVTVPSMLIMLVAPFYKSLADRYGRKLFLVLNTLIMGIGLLVCMIAPNIAVYVVGVLLVTFVMSNDMQVMYVMETAPDKHRAKLCSLTKAVALVGVSLIGVSRKLFYNPDVPSTWRYVFLIPAVFGIAAALLCIPFIKETPVFRKKRIEYLRTSDEEREAIKKEEEKKKQAEKARGGVIVALKYIFKTPQLRYATLAGLIFCLATGITSYYTTILEAANASGKITSDQIDTIIIFFPFINGLMTFVSGFISDALGRKKGCVAISLIAVIGLVGFILGARLGFNALVIGFFYGLFIGALWSVSDTIILVIPSESTPTELRASVVGTLSLFSSVSMLLSIILVIAGVNLVGAENLGIFCLCTAVPFLIVSLLLLHFKVKETAGNNLDTL